MKNSGAQRVVYYKGKSKHECPASHMTQFILHQNTLQYLGHEFNVCQIMYLPRFCALELTYNRPTRRFGVQNIIKSISFKYISQIYSLSYPILRGFLVTTARLTVTYRMEKSAFEHGGRLKL